MERRAEAQALLVSKEEDAAQAATAVRNPLLSETCIMWLNRTDGIDARLDLMPGDDASEDTSVAVMLRIVPTVAQAGDTEQCNALRAWATSSSPLYQDGNAPVFVPGHAQSFALPLTAVVYFCVEEPVPEAARRSVELQRQTPVALGAEQNCSAAVDDVASGLMDTTIAGIADPSLKGVVGTGRVAIADGTRHRQTRLRKRQPLASGEAMLHIVLLEMEWDRSLTLRCGWTCVRGCCDQSVLTRLPLRLHAGCRWTRSWLRPRE